ncbi:protein NDNF-like [Rhincodon typus]|uniref:protein NDNF-like n=1 Tax=Rhincodon typus TaxID=259920 RepID=UPI0009A297F2|nr:protein NDNF-like [Rhincodon typus]XP_048459492.1 protein NDNF-like [Rhincodon typus]XP_048459494.1 protein NDNF-like [Rhincodon typus]XP_048459495.1 protein NDNF-like [Rhincodon typus]
MKMKRNMLALTSRDLLCTLFLCLVCSAQKLPGRDPNLQSLYSGFIVQDLTALPDGAEIAGFLMKDIPKRYYFIVEEDSSPVTVTVTPCEAPLQWTLTLQVLQDQTSQEGSGESETLHLQIDPKMPLYGQSVELFSYRGNDVESYAAAKSPSGIYRLDLVSIERDTIFNIYATTTPESDQPYPELPSDSRLGLTFVGHTSISLVWKPSLAITQFQQPAQYCVVINREHNYKSLCAVEAKLRESTYSKRVRWPDLDWRMPGSPRLASMANRPIIRARSTKFPAGRQGDIRKICTGTKNVFTVSQLTPSTQYYVDVFIVNLLTNASAAYIGTFVKTKDEVKRKVLEVKGGRVTEIPIKRGASRTLEYKPASSHRVVTLSLHSCYQPAHVQIRQNRKIVASQRVEGVKHFQFVGKPKARYQLHLRAGDAGRTLLKVHMTTHPNKQPFPSLPRDTRLKVFDRLRSCCSLTVAWLATQEANKYCIYRKQVTGQEDPKELQNHCLDPTTRSKSEKVSCQFFGGSSPQKAVMTERVEGLEPGRTYQLDVYVKGQGRHSVKYQSKIVKTRMTC